MIVLISLQCVIPYITFEIQEGAYEIACPDARCVKQGILTIDEIEGLVGSELTAKHKKFRLFRGKFYRKISSRMFVAKFCT